MFIGMRANIDAICELVGGTLSQFQYFAEKLPLGKENGFFYECINNYIFL